MKEQRGTSLNSEVKQKKRPNPILVIICGLLGLINSFFAIASYNMKEFEKNQQILLNNRSERTDFLWDYRFALLDKLDEALLLEPTDFETRLGEVSGKLLEVDLVLFGSEKRDHEIPKLAEEFQNLTGQLQDLNLPKSPESR